MKRSAVTCLAALGLLILTLPGSRAAQVPEMVREDWNLRESLRAIRDWEAILAAWEQVTPEDQRTPVLPVPATGEAARYPMPVPLSLLPVRDRAAGAEVRLLGGELLVTRRPAGTRETFPLEAPVVAYHHPGGGGADRWYHAYFRRFDGLLSFRARPAPFALHLATPLDLRRGSNALHVTLRNTGSEALGLDVELRHLTPAGRRELGREHVAIAPGAEVTQTLGLELSAPGGGLAILTLRAGGEQWWVPLLTHVEDVQAILDGVRLALGDTPDPEAEATVKRLALRVDAWRPGALDAGASWRALFEEASALREDLLLRRLDAPALLFVKREAFDSEQPYMDAHHLLNRPGGGIYRLKPARPDGTVVPVVDSLGVGIYRDLCLDWDAGKLLFAFGNGSDDWDGSQSYHLYEAPAAGGSPHQLTFGPKNDCEPFYLPNGQIGFTSDRSEHFVMCGAARHVANLFVLEERGREPRQLSFNVFNDFTPSVLPDGRIIYARWEYNERSVTSLHKPFTIRPDGTMMAPYYGNATIVPNVVMFPRAVPGSTKVMGLFTAHHGQTHGPVGLIDNNMGLDGPEPVQVLTPGVPVTGEKALDSAFGWFSDPVPLSEKSYLCSFAPVVVPWTERAWGLYVGDRHGNLALLYRDQGISCAEPLPLVPHARPHVLPAPPPDSDAAGAEARVLMQDVYRGLSGVAPDAVRYLRIVEDVPRKSVHAGGVVTTSGTSIYTVKRIWGTVPIEADGSAHFAVPANRNIYFEALNGARREIQRMRSVVCLKPGETRTCVGCHEPRTSAPPVVRSVAFRRAPAAADPPPWGTQVISYLRDVQPLINEHCVQCHTYDRPANRVILTDDLTDQFCVGYEELLPYLSVANAMRWDYPEDVEARPPYTYGSQVSPLMKLLDAGHYGVSLTAAETQRLATWIDANAVYYDRYESAYGDGRSIFSGSAGETARAVFRRRCASCHGDGDGRLDTWWLSLNRRDVRLSRALQAPLTVEAGGWGRCEGTVFASTSDPDYRTLLGALTDLSRQLLERPREDLLSLRGTPAETQPMLLPPLPPQRETPSEVPAGWLALTSLPWTAASAGWTATGDGVPRRGADAADAPLRLEGRRYRQGIGTHAPSEITYDLAGRYERFQALVGGAESGGSVRFEIWGDGAMLFDSGPLQGMRGTATVDVCVTGVQRLRLVVTDTGDGIIADMANWAAPRLRPVAGY